MSDCSLSSSKSPGSTERSPLLEIDQAGSYGVQRKTSDSPLSPSIRVGELSGRGSGSVGDIVRKALFEEKENEMDNKNHDHDHDHDHDGISNGESDRGIRDAPETNTGSSSLKGRCGLANLGATCYLNSLVQMLYSLSEFRDLIFSCSSTHDPDDLIFQLQVLFYRMEEGEDAGIVSLPTAAVSLVHPASSRGKVLGDGETWEGEVYPASDDEHERGVAAQSGDAARQQPHGRRRRAQLRLRHVRAAHRRRRCSLPIE